MIYVMSGGTKLFAAIGVTYPEGSALTCANNINVKMVKSNDVSAPGGGVNPNEILFTRSETMIPCLAGATYTVKAASMPTDGTNRGYIYFYDENLVPVGDTIFWGANSNSVNFTVPNGGTKLSIEFRVADLPEEDRIFTDVTFMSGEIEKKLKAKTTTGQWVFAIPEAGTWTVTSTDPADTTKTKSQSVSITAEGQCENVELLYDYVLFDEVNGLVAGFASGGGAAITVETDSEGKKYLNVAKGGSNAVAYFTPAKDLTEFKELEVYGYCTSGSRNIQLWTKSPSAGNGNISKPDASEAIPEGTVPTLVSLPIAQYSGEYFIGFEYFKNATHVYRMSLR